MIVARYVMPKEYVKSYTPTEPPENHGMDTDMPAERVDLENKELSEPSLPPPQDEGGNLDQEVNVLMNEELSESSRLPPQDEGGNLKLDNPVNEELSEPSRLPPQDEGDPFVVVEDEPGEQGHAAEDEPGEPGRDLQPGDGPRFIGGTKRQRRDYEESMHEWSGKVGYMSDLGFRVWGVFLGSASSAASSPAAGPCLSRCGLL